ncbi:MAG TPA: molybdopterin-synthase adenylyltransferase MoeB [Thermoanaerobaculia bacterium]|nr:molybdopterin-synthase adenylyltransferase MoeB [Thermoanaerobaculia bacterium]
MTTAAPPPFSPAELRRYARHLILPEIGMEGQRRLKAARVLLVGAGGLGSPAGLYLAAAGVGRLGVVDFDRVDESNLQRQVLYGQGDLGRPKVEAAVARLADLNPEIEVVAHPLRLDASNALDLVGQYDVVVDGSDNFPTRYLVNDACVLAGRPNVYGSIFRFEGQVAVFWGARGPCYRCLFAEPPPPHMVPNCAEGGVRGVLPGIVGALQANEAIKLAAGIGEPLIGRLVLFDALKLSFRELRLEKDPACPVCSEQPTVTELIDYEAFCGLPAAGEGGGGEAPGGGEGDDDDLEIEPETLARWLAEGRALTLLDVRTPEEHAIARLEGAELIPLPELPRRVAELAGRGAVVAYCHHGPRSERATLFLRQHGVEAINLAGGLDAWSRRVDPRVPRY